MKAPATLHIPPLPRHCHSLSSPARPPRPVAAFTLLELMVVVVLLGIMTALIVPEMRGTHGEALLRTSGRDLVNLCGIAYSRAVSFQHPHRIRLDPATGRFVLERRRGSDPRTASYQPVRDVPGAEGQIDSRITVSIQRRDTQQSDRADPSTPATDDVSEEPVPGATTLEFQPDGTADAADILLRDRDGFELVLRINPVTARVRILASSTRE